MIAIILIPIIITSFLIGKYTERFQWNKLIKLGRIPKPNNPNLNHSDYWVNNQTKLKHKYMEYLAYTFFGMVIYILAYLLLKPEK